MTKVKFTSAQLISSLKEKGYSASVTKQGKLKTNAPIFVVSHTKVQLQEKAGGSIEDLL